MLDQLLGVGLRASRSLDMTAASSADVNDERVRMEKIMKLERQSKVFRRRILREMVFGFRFFRIHMKGGKWGKEVGGNFCDSKSFSYTQVVILYT